MDTKIKRYRDIEFMLKGAANRHRIHIVEFLNTRPESSVSKIADEVKLDVRTTSEHLRKLVLGGIVMKQKEGNMVLHALTDRGKSILQFCRIAV